jgi:hypothetical protein
MKVVCIDNEYNENYLTIGEFYEVIHETIYECEYYYITDDNSKLDYYPKILFKNLSEYRNEKIDKLLENESKMYR